MALKFQFLTSIGGPASCLAVSLDVSTQSLTSTVQEGQLKVSAESGFRKRHVLVVFGDTPQAVKRQLESHSLGFRIDEESKFMVHFGENNVCVACVLHDTRKNEIAANAFYIWKFLVGHCLIIDNIEIVTDLPSNYEVIRAALKTVEGFFPRNYLEGYSTLPAGHAEGIPTVPDWLETDEFLRRGQSGRDYSK